MQVSAKLKNLRISPRKVRLVADVVRGKNVSDARIQLQFSKKKASEDILNLLNSAVSNAKNNFDLGEENLYIHSIFVNNGPILKRWRPRAMGRASSIKKRTCVVNIVLNEKEMSAEPKKEIGDKEDKNVVSAEKVVKKKESSSKSKAEKKENVKKDKK